VVTAEIVASRIAAVRQLPARTDASEIAVLVRDPGKAADLERRGVSVRVGEYGDTGSLARAMKGADRVLLVASSEFALRRSGTRT
jgi:NAD(P)H dehydrogenase (quinone)